MPADHTACRRCLTDDGTVATRRLWDSSAYLRLCDDCNDVVQGPDFIDVTAGNRVVMAMVVGGLAAPALRHLADVHGRAAVANPQDADDHQALAMLYRQQANQQENSTS